MESSEIIKIAKWVKENYSPRKCGWTAMRSMGNYDDCFSDGMESGTSWAAYEIGNILGLELKEPEYPEEDEY